MNDRSETGLNETIRWEAAQLGIRLWRNNVGATYNQNGQFIRYGLANDSKQVNDVIKSSDLIGIKPVLITLEMVGKTIGQFICRETKRGGWKYSDTPRERAQLRWIELINSLGGDACFVNDKGSFDAKK